MCKHFSLDISPISPGPASGGCAAPPLADAPWAVSRSGCAGPRSALPGPAGRSASGGCAGQPSGLQTTSPALGTRFAVPPTSRSRGDTRSAHATQVSLRPLFGPRWLELVSREMARPRPALQLSPQTLVLCTEQGPLQQWFLKTTFALTTVNPWMWILLYVQTFLT